MSSDIDFDELDKAVNSLMGNVKGEKEETPKPKTLEVKDTLKPGEEPEYTKLVEAAQKIGNEALVMEREQTLVEHFEPTQTAESAEYDKINELVGSVDDDDEKTVDLNEPDENENDSSDDQDKTRTVKNETGAPLVVPPARTAPTGRFMDVVHPSSTMRPAPISNPSRAPKAAETPSFSTVIKSEAASSAQNTDDTVQLTPFLPDANEKVEKRPLGATPSPFTDEPKDEADESAKKPSEEVHHEDQDHDSKPEAEHTAQEVVDEPKGVDATAIVTEMSPEERKLQEIESQEIGPILNDEDNIQKVESGDTEALKHHSESSSKESDDTKTEGAIYDTEQYHQPLAHPAKQKSDVGKVLIILLIIVIFAASAGAAYLFFA